MAKKPLPPEVPPEVSPARPDEAPPPKFATPSKADAKAGLPRVIKGIERAPEGCVRIKVRCDYTPMQPTKYVLCAAGDKAEEQAKEHYLELMNLDKIPAEQPQPVLVLTRLPD